MEDPLVLSIDRDGKIFLRETPVEIEDLVDQIKAQTESRGDDAVFLKGDREVPYGRIVEVLDVLHRGGIVHVGMVTDQPRKTRS
jgi:biopolymer transport protein TolR